MPKGEWVALNPPERSRTYVYLDQDVVYRNVTRIKISESGTHYLEADEKKAIIAPGWRAIEIDADAWTF